MMRIHESGKAPFLPGGLYGVDPPGPLPGSGNVPDHAEIPGHAAGIGHGIELEPAFFRTSGLACKIASGSGKRDRIIRLNHDMIFTAEGFKHFKGGLERDVLRQVPEERKTVLLRSLAPVVGPEHNVRFRRMFPDGFPDGAQPCGVVRAGPGPGGGPVIRKIFSDGGASFPRVADRVPGGKLRPFPDEDQSFCLGKGFEQFSVMFFEEKIGVRFQRMLVTGQVTVEVDAERVFLCSPDQIGKVEIAVGRPVDSLRKYQNRIEPHVKNGVQMRVGKLIEPPARMHHPRRKQRFDIPYLPFQEGSLAQIQVIFQPDDPVEHTRIVASANVDPFVRNLEME
ncbi:MAG: hypothetical protein BWY31_04680 [Lentisphaerae bacterium ADurb.Bin242]|nr:MAG: hypothetical protein BWY31_04680 [Lentisphaerae bacterium ADurb.Bin242]